MGSCLGKADFSQWGRGKHLLVKENNYMVKRHKRHEKRSRWQVGGK